jgi:DNA-binding response OmpR family regulator
LTIQDLRIDGGSRRVWQRDAELDLTRKEFDLLLRLAHDAGRVVSREDLMSDVWDANWFGSTKTLDVHIGWLRRKLGDDPESPAYIRTVRGVGFELVTGPED